VTKFQVGDRVRVRKPADVKGEPLWNDYMDRFDGTEQTISVVRESERIVRFVGNRSEWSFHFDWLEPVAPKTLNVGDPVEPIRSWVPDGYSVVEMAVPDAMAAEIGEGNALIYKTPQHGQKYFWLCGNSRIAQYDWSGHTCPVIVPTTPPAPKYREPTQADVGKMVEVRDREKEPWQARELLAVIGDETIVRRFICRDLPGGVRSFAWEFARIKNEEAK
jgi:hypothetical protein